MGSKIQNRELVVEKVTQDAEIEILFLKKKKFHSYEIADIVLRILRKHNTAIFLRFVTRCKDIRNEYQMKKELQKYFF